MENRSELMKGLFLYVTAGKGHQTPSDALRDAMLDLGHEAVSIDMFDMLHDPFTKKYIQTVWRNELRHPPFERISDAFFDTKFNGMLMNVAARCQFFLKHYFRRYMEEVKPDFILGTHCFVNQIVEPYVRTYGFNIPVYGYAPDIFFYPNVGASRHMDRIYVCSSIGSDWLLQQGFRPDQISLCPFPLKHSIEAYQVPTKEEARRNLGLDEHAFTVLMNLGGEGIGNTKLIRELAQDGFRCQFVVVGRMSPGTKRMYDAFKSEYPDYPLFAPGFTDKMLDYIAACDIQVGKAGANSMMESLYLKRPFIISEQLYPAFRTSLFLEEHKCGWIENSVPQQAKIIERYASSDEEQKHVAFELEHQPMTFGAKAFVKQIMEDTESWYDLHR